MKAIGLISGGLDSVLAVKAIQKQGIEVIAVYFLTPFSKYDSLTIDDSFARKFTEKVGCEFRIVELKEDYIKMLKEPKYGYGKNINPCIDCKILMLRKAKAIMSEVGADFIFTGEVIGQRPMSQNKRTLRVIEKESGLEGLSVRPLSALLLLETIPEKQGILKKEFLFDIQGRSRKKQIELANSWQIKGYPWPSGGCALTDPNFSRRLKDLFKYQQASRHDIELAKIGRYFRISPSFRLTVGRNEQENSKLMSLAKKEDIIFEPLTIPGPTGLGRGVLENAVKFLSSQIIARYASCEEVEIRVKTVSDGKEEILSAKGEDCLLNKLRI